MAGHSKFKNIMHRKGAQDKKRAKVFSRLGREISVSVKTGGPDVESNTRLRSAINTAKSLNMPKDNIERAIKKGEGNDPDSNYEEVRYEGYGPVGTAIIVEAMTNNKNRTAAEIRSIFSKSGGNLGESGSVSFSFRRLGAITIEKNLATEEEIFDFSAENGSEDLEVNEEDYIVYCEQSALHTLNNKIISKFGSTKSADLIWKSDTLVEVEKDSAEKLIRQYHTKAPFVKKLMDNVTRKAEDRGKIRTLGGRACHFDLWQPVQFGVFKPLPLEMARKEYDEPLKRAFTYKALNKLIQGSAADMTKKSMVALYENGIIPHIQIHDEVDISVESDKKAEQIIEIMESAVELKVPNKVDYEHGKNWGEIK